MHKETLAPSGPSDKSTIILSNYLGSTLLPEGAEAGLNLKQSFNSTMFDKWRLLKCVVLLLFSNLEFSKHSTNI